MALPHVVARRGRSGVTDQKQQPHQRGRAAAMKQNEPNRDSIGAAPAQKSDILNGASTKQTAKQVQPTTKKI